MSHQRASLSTSPSPGPRDRQTNWARTWLVCCCQEAWHWRWHCALLSPSGAADCLHRIRRPVLIRTAPLPSQIASSAHACSSVGSCSTAQHSTAPQLAMHLLHILAAICTYRVICAIQEPLCGAWRRPTQVSQGHLSVLVALAVHEPLCCALIRGSRNAALGPPIAATAASPGAGEPSKRRGSGEVWLSLRSTEERDRIA